MNKLKNVAVAIASMVAFSNVSVGQAIQANYNVNAAGYEAPFAVKYLGNDGIYLLFEVNVKSAPSEYTHLAIVDKKEGELYASRLSPDFDTKTIKIERNGNQVINFKLMVGRKTYSKVFSVNTSNVETTTVAERDITKL